MNSNQMGYTYSIKTKNSFFESLFYLVFLLITFSGSTILQRLVPYLFLAYPVICFSMAKTKWGKGTARVNKNRKLQYPILLILLFVFYLAFQLHLAYVPSVNLLYEFLESYFNDYLVRVRNDENTQSNFVKTMNYMFSN